MSDLLLIHRPFSNQGDGAEEASVLVWKTCLRQIFFLDRNDPGDFQFHKEDQVFTGLDAESFLAEVLCGLKSSLMGETEVFGQFKFWWKSIAEDQVWKKRHQTRVEGLFSLVKNVREKALCGQGSQSYGSLLRRFLTEQPSPVDIVGNGQLAQEIAPWIQKKSAYRIWARDPQKVSFSTFGKKSEKIFHFNDQGELSRVVIVAAPLSHQDLNLWLIQRSFSKHHTLFDFRADSNDFVSFVRPKVHLKLGDFSSKHAEHRNEIEKKVQKAQDLIAQWKEKQQSKAQVRPYGWDDL